MRLFVGDDWAEDHHDVEVMDEAGKVLARKRLPEGAAGIAQLHGLVGGYLGEDAGRRRGDGRDRDRPRPVGRGAGRGRVPGVPGEPAAGGPVPRAARRVGGQERRRRRARAGRHGPHRLPPAAPGGRGQPGSRGHQGARAHPQDDDLGADPGRCSGCGTSCGSTSPPRWRPSRTWTPPTPWNCSARHPSRPARRG